MKRSLFATIVLALLVFPALAHAQNVTIITIDDYESMVASTSNGWYKFIIIETVFYNCDDEPPSGFSPLSVFYDQMINGKYYRLLTSGVTLAGVILARPTKTEGAYITYEVALMKPCGESECDQYKNLFDPPAPDCNFIKTLVSTCFDGEGNPVRSSYEITASDGRVAFTSVGGDETQCVISEVNLCGGDGSISDCGTPFTPSDEPGSAPDDSSDGTPSIPDNCQTLVTVVNGETTYGVVCYPDGQKPPETDFTDDWLQRCAYQDESGTWKMNPDCLSGGGDPGTGGGDPGTGGGGSDPGGGSSGGGGDPGTGGGDPGTGGSGSGGGGGGGSGSGDGDGNGFDGNFGSDSDGVNAVNQDGWGDGKGDYSLERGQGEHKDYLDGLGKSGPLKEIKDHQYISTSSGYCSVNLSLFNRTHVISLCEHQQQINNFGRLLLSLAGLSGLFIVLRR